MYKRLLVAVDGSADSLNALKEAFKLKGAEIVVVSVAPPFQGDLSLTGVQDIQQVLAEPCTKALAVAQEMAAATGAEVKTICAFGEIHEAIIEQAEEENCDLIVMGAKGHGLVERYLLGSVTRRVIGYSSRDVLVFPPGSHLGWLRILLPTDGSKHSEAATDRALELAQAHGSHLLVLSAVELPFQLPSTMPELEVEWHRQAQAYTDSIKVRAESLGIKADSLVLEGEAYQVIPQVAAEHHASLVVMGSHGKTGLTRLLMGSVTERVLGLSPCPVLVVKEGS